MEVALSNIFLLTTNPTSIFDVFIVDKYFNIFLYFKFLNSGFILLWLINLKLNFDLVFIFFLSEIEISLLSIATLNK